MTFALGTLGGKVMDTGECFAPRHSGEEWNYIRGYEGIYKVSSYGAVLSCRSGRLLSPYLVKGYPVVSLRVDGQRRAGRIHTLVAETFIGPRPSPKMHCAHLDGNPLNNRVDNLAWVTPAENEAHKRRHGSAKIGEKSHHAKLTDEQAEIIRNATKRPLMRRELAKLAGVSERTIDAIVAGHTYRQSTLPSRPFGECRLSQGDGL